MKGFDLSSLFSGMNSGGLFGNLNISDYSSIKNGSYRKLMKSYYAENKDISTTSKKTSTKKNTIDKILEDKRKVIPTADKSGSTQMKRRADSLKEAAEALDSEDLWEPVNGKYDRDKIASAVKSFVNEYNDTLAQSTKYTSKDVSQDVKYMSSMTSTMAKSLEKIGITIGVDGKLALNEDTLKNADISKIKSLFTGKVSYGSQVAGKAANISKDAVLSASVYGSNGMLSNSLPGLFDKTV